MCTPKGAWSTISYPAVEAYCLSFPQAYLDHPWGDPVIKVAKKIFVFLGSRGDALTVTVKLSDELRELWLDRSDAFFPAYVGRFGWRGIVLSRPSSWETAQEGITVSYRLIAPRRLWQGP